MKPDKRKQGKRNKQAGAVWESKVRANLESKGFIVCKWHNQVDLDLDKIVPAKHKFNFFTKVMSLGSGFPDFIVYKLTNEPLGLYDVIGVECKAGIKGNCYLDKTEKAKVKWLLTHNVFSTILIATKKKVGRRIVPEYTELKL